MKKIVAIILSVLLFAACGQHRELVDMTSAVVEGRWRTVIWEDRTYEPFCVVSKNDRGAQIG